MFDLQELKVRASYVGEDATREERLQNFVGIRRNSRTNNLEFCLPKGFEAFPKNNFDSLKQMFFRTYKTYRKFFEEKKQLSENKSFDGFSEFEGGYQLIGKDDQIATYSKLNVFDSILDAYNELQILTLQSKLSRSSEINYSKIEKYLHRGIYLEDDAVFIDEMEIPKKIIDLDSPTLVQMFCYIYIEIKNALEETIESHRTKSLAQEFKEKYLSQNSSLFDQETFSETLTVLKDTLDDIEKFTPYKDEDYWHFFQAIYTFLYGENDYDNTADGAVWGLDNFSLIWEELCFNYAKEEEYTINKILFADRFGRFSSYNGFRNPFIIQINGGHPRYLRPDLVVIDESPSDWHTKILEFLEQLESDSPDDFNKLVEFTLGFLRDIFSIEAIPIPHTEFVNLKLTPRIANHSYQDLVAIYNRFVEKNPGVLRHPDRINYRNVAEIHKREFVEALLLKLVEYKTDQLINRKPLLFTFTVIDYKYVAEPLFRSYSLIPERQHDVKKQIVYEMALQSGYETSRTKSQFWIPGYFQNENDGEIDVWAKVDYLNSTLVDNGIEVLKLNFQYLQSLYIQQ